MTAINANLIEPGDARWRGFLDRVPHDAYHLPQYVVCAARHEGGTPAAFYAEARGCEFLAPLLIRPLPACLDAPVDWRDAASPYGYPGPLASDPGDRDGVTQFLRAFRDVGWAHGIISAFFRLHPLLALPPEALATCGRVRQDGQVVVMDLSRPPEELWSQLRPNHRSGINKLARAGFTAVMDDWDRYGDFVRLYRRTMERVTAADFYFFSDAYFDDLRCALGDRLHLCSIVAPQGEVAAAALFFATGDIVQYHLGATADAFLSHAPSKLIFDFVRRWGAAEGRKVLNLGGGVGGQADCLFHFKAGFSPLRAEFATFRMILDEARYQMLIGRSPGVAAAASGYFPAYRQPESRA